MRSGGCIDNGVESWGMSKPSKKRERREERTGRTGGTGRGEATRRDQIERNLKRVYDETLEEPLPDNLVNLLERLRKQGRQ